MIKPSPVDRQGNEVYTVPGYNCLKAGSKWVGLALRNLPSKIVTLKRGTIVAHVSAVNEVPSKLVPKDNHKSILCKCAPKYTPSCGG